MSRPLRWFGLIACLVTPAVARAEDRVSASWDAPRECPSSAELAGRTTARVPPDAHVRATGRVVKVGAKYRLTLAIETASSRGERDLEADSCDALATSAAVVISMSVTSRPDADAPAPAPPAAPAPAPAPGPAPAPAPDRPATPPSDSALLFAVRPDLLVDAGLLPSFGVGGGAAVGLRPTARLHVEAHASAFGSRDGTTSSDPSRGATFSLFSAGGRACWSLTTGVEVAPCIGVLVARLSATGFGAAKVADGDSVMWGPEAGIGLFVPVKGPLGVRAALFGHAPISRQSFVITARGIVHEAASVVARGAIGPEVRF